MSTHNICFHGEIKKKNSFFSAVNNALSGAMLTMCSVMLIKSSDSRNCSRIYFGAMSTKACNEISPLLRPLSY